MVIDFSGLTNHVAQVLVPPYPVWGPPASDNPFAKIKKYPTASPPPQYVLASLTFDVFNQGTDDIPAGWNFTIVNSYYSSIQEVCPYCTN